MLPVHLRNLVIPRNKPEDREVLEEDTLDTVVDGKKLREIIPTRPFTFQFNRNLKPEDWKDMESCSALSTPQISFPMEHGQQEVQPSIPWGRTWSKVPEDMSQRDTLQRSYGNHPRMEAHQTFPTPGGEGN
ncbi:hypothetical protein O181_001470 [Austropuccinia psidii MF-1]|uniref:Uncharacterized protein n=1 Tax=Austropuccinia psidii MF-1 TaxID=1389203 RepID=A0A9Q3GBV4_9BASI|nr:hypothetical protein [Austropuccinia psidii MF-1]